MIFNIQGAEKGEARQDDGERLSRVDSRARSACCVVFFFIYLLYCRITDHRGVDVWILYPETLPADKQNVQPGYFQTSGSGLKLHALVDWYELNF